MYKIFFNYYQTPTNKFKGYRPSYIKKNKPFKKLIHKKIFTLNEAYEILKRSYTKINISSSDVIIVEVTLEKDNKLIDLCDKVVFSWGY